MTQQTFMPGTEPPLATGPWSSEVETAEAGKYLVVCSNRDGEMDVFITNGQGDWICERHFDEQPTPKLIARIYPLEKNR